MTTRCVPSVCLPRRFPSPLSKARSWRPTSRRRNWQPLPPIANRRMRPKQRPRRRRRKPAATTSAWKTCWVAEPRRRQPRRRMLRKRFRRSKARLCNPNWLTKSGPARVARRGSTFIGTLVGCGRRAARIARSSAGMQERKSLEIKTNTVNNSAAQVKELRDKSGAPMMDCKKALAEAGGDLEQAIILLRKRGTAVAERKAGRVTSEGSVASYIHAGGKIGVLVEVNCESDFVARTEDFKELVHDVAMHIAASDPKFIRKEDVTPEAYEKEKDICRAQAATTGKPANVIEKIVEGKMGKFYEEVCLYEQPFIKDQTISVSQLIAGKIGKLGENIAVRRFARFKVGEAGMTVAATVQKTDEGEAPAAK